MWSIVEVYDFDRLMITLGNRTGVTDRQTEKEEDDNIYLGFSLCRLLYTSHLAYVALLVDTWRCILLFRKVRVVPRFACSQIQLQHETVFTRKSVFRVHSVR